MLPLNLKNVKYTSMFYKCTKQNETIGDIGNPGDKDFNIGEWVCDYHAYTESEIDEHKGSFDEFKNS